MSDNRPRGVTRRFDPNGQLSNNDGGAEVNEPARREFLRLRQLQMRLLYAVWAAAAVAIGLYFANQILLAQIGVGVATILLLGLFWVSYLRYKRNRERREEIMAHLTVEQDDQLRDLFNQARREKGLPPDEMDTTGYTAQMRRERARIAEKTGQPDRVTPLANSKQKGSGDGGKQS
jgi:hypothetical protein